MTTTVEAKHLQFGDLFQLQNDSVYQTADSVDENGTRQARLWCAHHPDQSSYAPALIDLAADQQVHILSRGESGGHSGHHGYVRAQFEQEMTRRHHERMQAVYERQRQHAPQPRQRRSWRWWKHVWS